VKLFRRVRGTEHDSGLSLIETIVAIGITLSLMGAVTATMILTQRSTARSGAHLDDVNQARVGLDAITRSLRAAILPSQLDCATTTCAASYAFISGNVSSVSFYANINDPNDSIGPSQVTYYTGPDSVTPTVTDLFEKIEPPDLPHAPNVYTWLNTTTAHTRVLSRNLSNTNIFAYYDSNLLPIGVPALTSTTYGQVRMVDVSITVQVANGLKQTPTQYVERIGLPNVDTLPSASPTS
jgi:hypothetical protein